jgi:hypothetical protein
LLTSSIAHVPQTVGGIDARAAMAPCENIATSGSIPATALSASRLRVSDAKSENPRTRLAARARPTLKQPVIDGTHQKKINIRPTIVLRHLWLSALL